ncbi:hypothetical protein RvY_03051 [Ramazzottius varieornatus]|uniref:Uncharacterized protein n=1 Tax=Ramazzottius varieornatus TaxID=947166 RepID=A0A1D1UQJ3_RAMVA|nr:hypothetical protein RvY_03051 [Ramazzottius varieornatus]
MFTYYRMDVTVLSFWCQQFQELYMTITSGVYPFVSVTMVAGVCIVSWRTNFLQNDQVAIVFSEGQNRLQPVVGVQWLEWTARKLDINIDHRDNGHGKQIGKFFVDGYCEATSQASEFHGCFSHDVLRVFHPTRFIHFANTMKNVHNDTMARRSYVEDLRYEVVTCWECQFKQEARQDEELRDFFMDFVPMAPLHPRDAWKCADSQQQGLCQHSDD